ncbi:uncharacterized protein V1518DRAFT_416656 [Limtongia smithiae]|uniref:uncharacterized protein n=1 Tax=Limtongia smithiae TaxID=1125753 RepID=UPI0034CFDA44
MPPKREQKPEKALIAKKQQAVADKTFGLKNKNKSAKVQKFVQQVEQQGQSGLQKKKEAEKARALAEKKAAEKARLESAALFNPVAVGQKVPFGVDPKTVLCIFFKQGTCTKGSKCKFSHNLDIERKTQKADLYTDSRETKRTDDMTNWDDEKLRSVVLSKQGNPKTTTNIVCKYFIEAVEARKYGWFWVCPNGGDNCQYKHSLPPGFTLKTNEQRQAERAAAASKPTLTLEDFLETERHKLGSNLTPVTLETFTKWKSERAVKKAAEEVAAQKKNEPVHSGKWLFDHGKFDTAPDDDEDDDDSKAWNMDDLRRRAESVDGENDDDQNSNSAPVDGSDQEDHGGE